MLDRRFHKHEHLRRPGDFRNVYEARCSSGDDWLVVFVLPNQLPHARVGLSVAKKFGNAVARNRIRRVFREAFRLGRPNLPVGWDYVMIPRTAKEPTTPVIQDSLVKLARRLTRQWNRDKKTPCSENS